jgi:hypothetical protein
MVKNEKLRYSLIEQAITNIEAGHYSVSRALLDVAPPFGYSSPKVRELLNRMVRQNTPKMTYLEVGVNAGSTFFPAVYRNRSRAVAVDNWSYDSGMEDVFLEKLEKSQRSETNAKRLSFIKGDAFSIDLNLIPFPVTVYFYDGDHGRQAQYQAINYYAPVLADQFVFVVDDCTVCSTTDTIRSSMSGSCARRSTATCRTGGTDCSSRLSRSRRTNGQSRAFLH